MLRVYLDVCCFNRPFDDQTQERIRLETEAIRSVIARFESGTWLWVTSNLVTLEIERNRDPRRRQQVRLAMPAQGEFVSLRQVDADRARELIRLGFQAADALHLAFAEAGSVDVLLTTDDRLLRRAIRFADRLHVRVENPLR